MKTKTIKIYEPGDVVFDVPSKQFFLLANRVQEHDSPGKECFSAFLLKGKSLSEPRVIAQDLTKGNEDDTVRYVGKLYDYWKGVEAGSLVVENRSFFAF